MKKTVAVLGSAAAVVGTVAAPAIGASARAAPHTRISHALHEIETQVELSGSGHQSINVGVLDGKIGSHSVHGAIRATATFSGPSRGTGKRVEFDQYGSRTATLSFIIVTNPNGSKTDTGGGHWIGGTGLYRGATGAFTFKGTIPAGSTRVTAVFNGTIVY